MKKMKFKKISAILSGVLVAGLTIGTAAAASYPAPFVDNGVADVGIVYGTGAGVSTLDRTQAESIQTSLASEVTGTTSFEGGETFLLKATGDELTFGESFSDVTSSLDDTDFDDFLQRGTLVDDDVEYGEEEEVEYTQEITLPANSVTFGALDEDDYAVNTDLASDELPLLYVDQGTDAYQLVVEFATDINATAYDGSESFTIFGKTLTFDPEMEADDDSELVLFESTETVNLNYGESETINGDTIEVTGGTGTTANLVINGKAYSVSEGDTKEGYYVSNVVASTIGDGSVSVELFVGANEWVLVDGDEVEIDGEDVDGVTVALGGTNLEDISSITFTVNPSDMDADEAQFLEIGESFVDPLFGSFSLVFDSVKPELDSNDKDKIDLEVGSLATLDFTSRNGKTYEISPFEIDSTDTYVDVEDDWFVHANYTGLEKDHIFIASEGSGKAEETLIYQVYKVNDGDDTQSVEFKELSSGDTVKVYETKELADTGLYVSDLTDGVDTFNLLDATAGDPAEMNSELITESGMSITLKREAEITVVAADTTTNFTLNGDVFEYDLGTNTTTVIAGLLKDDLVAAGYDADNTDEVITISGFEVDTIVDGDNMNNTITTQLYFLEDADSVFSLDSEVTSGDLTVTVGVDTDDDELELSWTDSYFTEVSNTETDMEYAVSTLGTYYEADTDEKAYMNIWTPMEGQTVYDVAVTSGEATTTDALGDVVFMDTEISEASAMNLIIVGGSCINSAAATVLGGAYCGDDFTDATGVGEGQFLIKGVQDQFTDGKLALVVAGYNAEDTVNAATFLKNEDVDTSSEYIGTSSTSAELVVA